MASVSRDLPEARQASDDYRYQLLSTGTADFATDLSSVEAMERGLRESPLENLPIFSLDRAQENALRSLLPGPDPRIGRNPGEGKRILCRLLIIKTLWRWMESPANRSLDQIPC